MVKALCASELQHLIINASNVIALSFNSTN